MVASANKGPEVPMRGESAVYVVTPDALRASPDQEMDLLELWSVLVRGKWIILSVTLTLMAATAAYALLAPEWYRARVVLVPAEARTNNALAEGLSGLGALGGLASLAGITVGGADTAEPIAVLRSAGFARAFIEEGNLLPVLFARKWDAQAGRWKAADPEDWPDMHDAVKFFEEDILSVQEDKRTRLVTVTVNWKDPKLAAEWANELVKRLNERMRQRALREAESSVNYLKRELTEANVVALQQSIGRLLETELQKAMLARVSEEFAFRVVDEATPPKWRSWPRRTQLVALAGVAGIFLSCLFLVIRHAVKKQAPGTV